VITPAIILTRPSALLWALPAAVVVLLYLRSIRPPQVAIARSYIWKQVLGEARSSMQRWRRRRLVSAAIHVVVVLLLAFAAADPCLRQPRTVVFVVDTSQSMEAAEAGTTRLEEARKLLHRHLEQVGPREFAALITTAGPPVILSAAEQNHARLTTAVNEIRAADRPSDVAQAVDLAQGLAAPGTKLDIHVFSDGCFESSAEVLETEISIHPVGTAVGNAAISRLAVRRSPGENRRFQVIVEVANQTDAELSAPLQIHLDDQVIHRSECQVDAGSQETFTFDLESESAGRLVAVLDWTDALADDNRLETRLPEGGSEQANSFPKSSIAGQAACETRSPASWAAAALEPTRYRLVPLWPWAVLLAMILIAVELPLYHRRWTC
jgi:hypothetical protein